MNAVLQRRELNFSNTDAVIADVQSLRQGYTQSGNWTLPQICFHLTVAIERTGQPATEPPTPDQEKMRPILASILVNGKLPMRVDAPVPAIPPAQCADDCIDTFIAAVRQLPRYAGKSAQHRLFGPLTPAEYQRLSLIHCAHHLSHLSPIAST